MSEKRFRQRRQIERYLHESGLAERIRCQSEDSARQAALRAFHDRLSTRGRIRRAVRGAIATGA